MTKEVILPQGDEQIPFRWKKRHLKATALKMLRRFYLMSIGFLVLMPILIYMDIYSNTYLVLAHRFHWNLSETDWGRKDLRGCDFGHMSLKKASLSESILQGVDFSNSDLYEVELISSHLERAKFEGCFMVRANMQNCLLTAASLRKADLSNATLSGSNLKGVDLSYAILQNVNLDAVDLSEAKLEGTKLGGLHYNKYTIWPKGFHPHDHRNMVNDGAGYWDRSVRW